MVSRVFDDITTVILMTTMWDIPEIIPIIRQARIPRGSMVYTENVINRKKGT